MTWYTVSVIRHDKHPRDYEPDDISKPQEVVSCTVESKLAATILRATADEIAPTKPVTRRGTDPGEL